MSLSIQHEPQILILRISGILQRAEFGYAQGHAAQDVDAGAQPRILAILENFTGWEKGADWNDLDFMLNQGNEIAKIAIVGEPRWEPEALAFAGAGFRRAPVKFFPTGQESQARVWLTE
jgi:hypothetical protein